MSARNNTTSLALRGIPYGCFILTAGNAEEMYAGCVSWVSQCSFEPPLLMLALQRGSVLWQRIQAGAGMALNILDKSRRDLAKSFITPQRAQEMYFKQESFIYGRTGAAILEHCAAAIECRHLHSLLQGDHSIVIAEAIQGHINGLPPRRIDADCLTLPDLGPDYFYGG